MRTIPQHVCGAIPPHMLDWVAAQSADRGAHARATIEHTREIATERARARSSGLLPLSRKLYRRGNGATSTTRSMSLTCRASS